ncbi:MAG TPA: TIM barrel protein [Limnochordales bacterium]
MIRWSCNISMLFGEVPFLERLERARRWGFRFVECQLPYGEDPGQLAARLAELGLEMVLFNLPAGNWEAGERGIACQPHRRQEFREGVEQAVELALRLGTRRLNCLAGRMVDQFSRDEQWRCLVDNVRHAADRLAQAGLVLLVEPVNELDVPGYAVPTVRRALELFEEVGRPNLLLQCDLYHMQRAEGNLTETLRRVVQRLGHVQLADVPGRHQPGTGEVCFPFVLKELEAAGYQGFVGLEYVPLGGTEASLAQAARSGLDLLGLPHPGP